MITLRNLVLFFVLAVWYGVPPSMWAEAWEGAKDEHRQWVHKEIWELKKKGEVWEDENGYLHVRRK